MKEYDLIAFGTGSAMNIVAPLIERNPRMKVAVIENEKAGGICLTRGCIPSKMLAYPAELVHDIRRAKEFYIDAKIKSVDGDALLRRVQEDVDKESKMIEHSLRNHPSVDYYDKTASFVSDYTIDVGGKEIYGEKILLCTGSKPLVPPIPGLKEAGFITNREFFYSLKKLPKSIAIIGGGFVALELGHFMAMFGTEVHVIEMHPDIIMAEEPEARALVRRELSSVMHFHLGYKAKEVRKAMGKKVVVAENREGKTIEIKADEIMVATGRAPWKETNVEKTGVKTDERGWIITDEFLRTTKEGIWACGDANGKYLFKHVANYESEIVYYNAFRNANAKVDYHAIPHAIFTTPQVAGVGMKEEEAKKKHEILVGEYKYENTAMGEAMRLKDYFVKVIVDKDTYNILGATIVGPQASVLIQEIINLMYTREQASAMYRAIHIHPAMNEVVQRAFYNLREV